MTNDAHYEWTPEALEQAASLGLCSDGGVELSRMVLLSTRVTHPQANCRFKDFLFTKDGQKISFIGKLSSEEKRDLDDRSYGKRKMGEVPDMADLRRQMQEVQNLLKR